MAIIDLDGHSKLRRTVLDPTAARDILGLRDDWLYDVIKFLSTITFAIRQQRD